LTHTVLVPDGVQKCLDAAELSENKTWLVQPTDVSLLGESAVHWVVATQYQLIVVDPADKSPILRRLDLADIEQVRTQSGVGGGTLQAKFGEHWLDLLRYSNSLATRFHKVSRALERWRETTSEFDPANELAGNGSGSSHESTEAHYSFDPPQCDACGLRLTTHDEACPRCMQRGQILRRVIDLIKPYRRGAVFLCLLTAAGVGAELIPPKLQQYMIDYVLADHLNQAADGTRVQPDFKTALLLVVLALAGSRVLLALVGVIKGRIATAIGTGLTSTLRAQMVRKLQSLAIVYFDRHQVGSMLSRVAHDSEVLHGLMHQITGGFLLQIAQLLGVGAMLISINPKLAMYTLIPVPLVFIGTWIFWNKVYPRYYRLWDASAKQMSVLSGMLSGIRVVKAFGQEDREYSRFSKSSEHLRDWRLWVENTSAWYSATMSLVFSLGGLIVWYVGGRDVIGKSMTLGELIAFLAYLAMFYAPLSALSNFTSWLTSFLTGSKRVLELLDTPLTIAQSADPKPWTEVRGAIRFENVSFGYDRNQPVLRNVSFNVEPGEMIGIVGRSGSGKSTMVNLLGRFYDVQEGRITIDDIDLRDLSTQELRHGLGIVFQESFLFRGTIWKNLSYGRPVTDIPDGLAAAKAAGAHDFICRQHLGYETLLGEHGAGLSGGEKQRLSIARTLLYDPKILVLDEATSNIDAEAEKSIQDALNVLIKGRTTIAIAHRLSTLRNANRILVFDRGQLIEHGTHAELLSKDGTYAKLVRIQTSVSKDPSVDRLLSSRSTNSKANTTEITDISLDSKSTSAATATLDKDHAKDSPSDDSDTPQVIEEPTSTAEMIRWLEPVATQFKSGEHDRLEVWLDGERIGSSAFIVRTFPASHPTEFLSVRGWNQSGDEVELGMIRKLDVWPSNDVEMVKNALKRRYLLRKITRVYEAKLKLGYLDLTIETEWGQEVITLRWTQSQAIDFGDNGKLIIDTKENRYIVEDIEDLPTADRERFLQYVYW
jgi:ATP-binding cassette, subfamily B, bacterial